MNWWGWLYLTIAISLVVHLVIRLNQPDQSDQLVSSPAVIKERIIIVPPEQNDTMRFRFTP